ncbi:hypothetical protein B484DRAFT_401918 [Ochromonadaceae sp. CCMP2298]|nr:hypothetical protein B484DRAFT_401918 [Ochromonadaceae sp. CCMP2298]
MPRSAVPFSYLAAQVRAGGAWGALLGVGRVCGGTPLPISVFQEACKAGAAPRGAAAAREAPICVWFVWSTGEGSARDGCGAQVATMVRQDAI